MNSPLESREDQLQAIEHNAELLGKLAYQGYKNFEEKGTLIILRQLEKNSTTLEDWQLKYRTLGQLSSMVSDWKESGLQELIIKYNPETSVICTFLYPNGAHISYHFSPDPPPHVLYSESLQGHSELN
jgi:hypothetical protein